MNLFPASLSPANLEKTIRSSLSGVKLKADPAELTKALKSLEQINKSVDTKLFEPVKLQTAAEVQARLQQLESTALKAAQAAAAQARKVAQISEKTQAELRSIKAAPKQALGAVVDVASEARDYADDVVKAAMDAQAQLKATLAALLGKEKKDAGKDKDGEDDAENEKDLKVVGSRVATAMKLARDAAGTGKAMKFMVGVFKKDVFVYVAKATSGSTIAKVKGWLNAGAGSVAIYRGDVTFENKAHTFVSVNIPMGGFAVRMQKALVELTGKKYKIRLRRPTGESDEAAGDDDGDDAADALKQAAEQGGRSGAMAGLVNQRHKKLSPEIDAIVALGGPMALLAKKAMEGFDKSVAAKKFDDAMKVLDEIQSKVVDEARRQRELRVKAEKEFTSRFAKLLPDVQKLIKAGGAAGDEIKRKAAEVSAAAKAAAKRGAQDAFDLAHRELDLLQKSVEWTLADKSPGERAADVERGAEQLKKQAEVELRKRLNNLKSNIDKAVSLAGKGSDAVKKRVADAERALEDAVKSGVKEAVDQAHRAIDVVQTVVDDALTEGDKQAEARQQAQKLEETIGRHRAEAAKELDKVRNPVSRIRLQALLKAIDVELQAVRRMADAQKQRAALDALRGKADKAEQFAKKLAGDKAKAQANAGKAKAVESAELKALKARFPELQAKIKALEAGKSPEAAALKKAAVAAGNLATSPEGIRKATVALDQVEAQVEDARLKLAEAQPPSGGKSDGRLPQAAQLAADARKRLKSQDERGRKAIAANPRNNNASWLAEVVSSTEERIAGLAKRGTQREVDDVHKQLEWLEKSIVRFERDAVRAAEDAKAALDEVRADLKALEPRLRAVQAAGGAAAKDIAQRRDETLRRIDEAQRDPTDDKMGAAATFVESLRNALDEVAPAASAPRSDARLPQADQLVADARKRLKSQEARGRKALAANPRNSSDDWLTEVVAGTEERIADLVQRGTQRDADTVDQQLEWLEKSIVRFERDAARAVEDAQAELDELRADLKALEPRIRAVQAAGGAAAKDIEQRQGEALRRIDVAQADPTDDKLGAAGTFVESLGNALEQIESEAKAAPAVESPELKKVKAHFKRVQAEVKKLADAKIPEAEALKQAAIDAGNLATSPKGIQRANEALDQVMLAVAKAKADAKQAKADAKQAKADADKAKADAAKAAAETFTLTVGGRKLAGVSREEAMRALKLELGGLSGQLEGGWAYHVDQMNLPSEVPFQAWLTTGVDAVKSFFKGQDAAKMPDLNIWDPAREMMIEVTQAEKRGDVKAIAALLPKIAKSVKQARSQVGKYDEQMQGSAQTGVDGGRFVEDTAASTIGALAEKKGGKAGKVAAQAAAQGLFQGVEQLTEWMIGTRREFDPGAVGGKMAKEAAGAIFKEIVGGALKGPFKSAFGSYIGKGVDDAALKAMGLSRDAFMTASQKYVAEFAAKQGAGLIKSAAEGLIKGNMPKSPEDLADTIAAELMKGSAKQLIVDGIKEIAKAAVVPK